MASRWEGVRLPRASGKSPDFPRSSPNFPGSFLVTSPEVLSLWNSTAIQRFPGSFPDFPGSSPNFPRGPPDFPGGQPLSLGSVTPSPDSQKLSLNTICPETITEIIRFEFLRCKNYVTAPEINSPRTPNSPEITVRKSLKSPVRITVSKNNSKIIPVM